MNAQVNAQINTAKVRARKPIAEGVRYSVPDTPIITSLLDIDLYKLTMMQWALIKQSMAMVEFEFKCRSAVDLTPLKVDIERELDAVCKLSFQYSELKYLKSLRFFKPAFCDFLKYFKLNRESIRVIIEDGQLVIRTKGPWFQVKLFEIYALAIVEELYMRTQYDENEDFSEARHILTEKIELIRKEAPTLTFADFSTRRRAGKEWQAEVMSRLQTELPDNFVGTSNVWLAKELGLTAIGTMAHEYLQAWQQIEGVQLKDFQKAAMQGWADVYRGDLGIVLTDIVGFDAFLKDFDAYFAKLYDGVRHDSGCPFDFGEKMIAHYEKLGIDPRTKTIVWSDGLDFPKMIALFKQFDGRIKTAFGIGTNLGNDVGYQPLSIVMKMTTFNDLPVAKISDSPGKMMCKDEEHLELLSRTFNIDIQG